MTDELILAIDNGTQSVRALLFDLQGRLVAKSQIKLTPYFSSQPGFAEQDPNYFWQSLCDACQSLWQNHPTLKQHVKGVVVTTQRGTTINLDSNGQPLRPAILWLDHRRTQQVPKIKAPWPWLFKIAGVQDTIAYFQKEAEINWIHIHEPDIWAKTEHYLLLSGYLNYKLTGEFKDSIGSQVGFLPFDYKNLAWAKAGDWRWQGLAIKPEWLPQLTEPGETLGIITDTAATETGIPKGLPVIAGASDKACEILGAGCLTPEIGCLSYGTTATVNTTNDKYVEPMRFLPAYPSASPRHYNTEVQIYRGFWMVQWFKQEFGLREETLAKERGIAPEILFDELIRDIPPGSMGLTLQPYWSPGVKTPGPEAKGAMIGFGDVHTRAHIYRAILEGLAYALREGSERIAKRAKTPIQSLRVSGGGSQSDVAMHITANVFNLPTARPHVYETSGLGASINAAVGLGLFDSIPQAVAAMTHIEQVFEPDNTTQATYEALYQSVYKKMYPRLMPLYQAIRGITGYPAK